LPLLVLVWELIFTTSEYPVQKYQDLTIGVRVVLLKNPRLGLSFELLPNDR
jgi:hypothetical protein